MSNIEGIPVVRPSEELRKLLILVGVGIKKRQEIIEYLEKEKYQKYCIFLIYILQKGMF